MGIGGRALALCVAAAVLTGTAGHVRADTARLTAGATLLEETFTGDTVQNEGFVPLNDACLTGAKPGVAHAPGDSMLSSCESHQVGPVPPAGRTPGYLQLTDTRGNTGGVIYNRPLPATGGLEVEFEQFQYGGVEGGGDGIAFFLVDGSHQLTETGAYGGSLGYAQRGGEPGVEAGYLGVGLDPYGNFAVDFEGRGTLCPSGQKPPPEYRVYDRPPNNVTLRGPGNGNNGYCYLAGTGTTAPVGTDPDGNTLYGSSLPGRLHEDGTDPAAAKRKVRVRVSNDAKPTVTVEIDFGSGFTEVLRHTMPEAPPRTYKFGWTASNGSATDVHLIRNVKVNSLDPLPQMNLVKQLDRTDPQPGVYEAGDTVPYQFVITNTGDVEIDDVRVDDPKVAGLRCPSRTLGAKGTPTATMTCTGTHVITAAEVAAGDEFTNTAKARGQGGGKAVTSNESSVTVPVKYRPVVPTAELTLDKRVSASSVQEGDVVTYTITGTNTGELPLSGESFTDDLTGVLDDAEYLGDAKASTGAVSYGRPVLTWTGDLARDASVTVTYSVRVKAGDTGDGRLRNKVRSPVVKGNCSPGSKDERCFEESTVRRGRLTLTKRADREHVKVGGTVSYRVTVANTGRGRLPNASLTDDLSDLLAVADLTSGPTADKGRVSYRRPVLSWSGKLEAGASATLRYTVRVRKLGDGRIRNVVVSPVPRTNCAHEDRSRDPRCVSKVRVVPKKLKDG